MNEGEAASAADITAVISVREERKNGLKNYKQEHSFNMGLLFN